MDKVALITGITGFVGPHLAKKLLDNGYRVCGLSRRRADGNKPRRIDEAGILDQIRLIEGDVTDLTSILFALDRTQPDIVFHLAAQSFVPRSFIDPMETLRVNTVGTLNILEAMRLKNSRAVLVFAGSSEEYGLQIASDEHYRWALQKYGIVFPTPRQIPELPINEDNHLRPMSPYAVSKAHGDYLVRNYFHSYGLKTIVSRAFNHEGSGRGDEFVTSTIVRQCVALKLGETNGIIIGNVNAFRDWSHVEDVTEGYVSMAERGKFGDVYVQGSMRTNTVASYILLTLEQLGYDIKEVETLRGEKRVKSPTDLNKVDYFGMKFEMTAMDELILKREIDYGLEDVGLKVKTNGLEINIEFDQLRSRPADVPILISNAEKASSIGFKVKKTLKDIINDQVNYYLNPINRKTSVVIQPS